jgi:hypothetical protein
MAAAPLERPSGQVAALAAGRLEAATVRQRWLSGKGGIP